MAQSDTRHPPSSADASEPRSNGAAPERLFDEASPRMKEALDQFSDVAGDLYKRANRWLSQGDNRTYGIIALIAAAGTLGFLMGRGLGNSSRED